MTRAVLSCMLALFTVLLGGVTLSSTTSNGSFTSTFDAGIWDVLVLDIPAGTLSTSIRDRMYTAITDGTVVIVTWWYLYSDTVALGFLDASVSTTTRERLPLSASSGSARWEQYETLPDSISSFVHDDGINGMSLEVESGASGTSLGVFSADEDEIAILATHDGQVMVNGFSFWILQTTDDDDGQSDMAELYVNEIAYALGCAP